MILRARQFEFQFPRPALVMGILNITPDSFSDGGSFMDVDRAVDHALEMQAQGADLIDVGGESTRPHAIPVPEPEELRRVLPVLERLAGKLSVPVSIDTMKPNVAREALAAGAAIINDVAANRQKTEMWEVAAAAGAGYVLMHMHGEPATMQVDPQYDDVLADVGEFFRVTLARVIDCGLKADRVILDPGIGFGKTPAHNLALLAGLRRFSQLGRPLLVGASRKSFISKIGGGDPKERLPGSLACACLAVEAGAGILRVHDVRETVQAVRMTEAVLASA